MKEYKVKRSNERDLVFRGTLLGSGGLDTGVAQIVVTIYKTELDRYIASRIETPSFVLDSQIAHAAVCNSAEEILELLVHEDNTLDQASKQALSEAAKHDKAFSLLESEEI